MSNEKGKRNIISLFWGGGELEKNDLHKIKSVFLEI